MRRLLALDDAAAAGLNASVHTTAATRNIVSASAQGLAWVEVLLMVRLAVGGRKYSALRMLAAVALVYLASEALGAAWPRRRPFGRLPQVEALVAHTDERSFPSRHVASGLAMAVVGAGAHPRLGIGMASVAGMLGVSRVAAGLHYPSDVLAGALVGLAIGRLIRRGERSARHRPSAIHL